MRPMVPWILLLLVAALSTGLACADLPAESDNHIDHVVAVLIAPDELADELQVLADWRCQTGLPTRLVPLSEALAAGDGDDDAAKLRDYLVQQYEAGQLEHVILGGDAGVLPVRQVWATVQVEAEQVYEEEWITTDLYFADLDGDWDPDGDGEYGEPADDADLLPDVSVGRLPVETADEVRSYIDKLMTYECTEFRDYQDKILLAASYAGMGVYASAGIELIVVPELPEDLALTRLYEDWEDHDDAEPLTANSYAEAFEAGHNLTFQMGHGNERTMGPLLDRDAVAALDNVDRPNVLVTCECLGGRFDMDNGDSSGETFVLGDSGGVAYLGSTHLGIGFPSFSLLMQDLAGTMTASDDRAPTRLGPQVKGALRRYSNDDALHTEANVDRWTQFVTVLLGDPTLPLWTGRPRPVELAVEPLGRCQGAEVTVTGRDGLPIAGATVTAFARDAFLYEAVTDADGQASLVGPDCDFADATLTVSGVGLVPAFRAFDD